MKVLIDNGHGEDTAGKCSPDGRYREYAFCRLIAGKLRHELRMRGVDAELVTPEMNDITLFERAKRVNAQCAALGRDNVLLVSIHTNAAGNGADWTSARGWCVYTSKGQTKSDRLADCLFRAATETFAGKKLRADYSDGDPDWEEDFYVLRKTLCAAVLTENFFHDNREDLAYLTSDQGTAAIVKVHADGICAYIAQAQ